MKNQKNYRYIISTDFDENQKGSYCVFDRLNHVVEYAGPIDTIWDWLKYSALLTYYFMFYDVKLIKEGEE